jgi:hypothetical protein
MKKRIKLAVIRKNESDPCPFGLPIPFACKHAGNMIEKLAPLDVMDDATEEEGQRIADANVRMLGWLLMKSTEQPCQCPYAAKIFKDKEAVECNYYDTAPGQDQKAALMAAPFYSQIFSGLGLNGLFTYPIGYYADYNISRNLFYGIFSLQGAERREVLKKLAGEALERAEREKTGNKSE